LKRFIALIVAVAAFAVVVAGCGSSDSTTDSTASLSKAEFVKQGNAICAAGNKEINAGFEELSFNKKTGPTEAQIEEVAEDTLVPSVTKQIGEIRALGAPSGEEEAVETFLENAEKDVEDVEEDPSSVAGNGDPFAGVNKEAKAIGLDACAE
jgi:hypothetical protein